MSEKLVAPSLLASDFANLESEINAVKEAGADWLHIDVMDGHFVPNLTIGAPVVKAINAVTDMFLDVHLMIDKPENLIPDFIKAGSDSITFHVEATSKVESCIELIKNAGLKVGISLKPETPIESIVPFLGKMDLVLIMTVSPGFGGQSFMQDQVEKINFLNKWRSDHSAQYLIEVDGGVNDQTKGYCQDADVLVAGSYIFKNNYSETIKLLKS